MTMFHVGQKVVCVDDEGSAGLTKGAVYTVSRVLPPEINTWRGEVRICVGLLLQEASPNWGCDCFAPERFRPAVERKTNISIFTEILDRANKRMSEKVE